MLYERTDDPSEKVRLYEYVREEGLEREIQVRVPGQQVDRFLDECDSGVDDLESQVREAFHWAIQCDCLKSLFRRRRQPEGFVNRDVLNSQALSRLQQGSCEFIAIQAPAFRQVLVKKC